MRIYRPPRSRTPSTYPDRAAILVEYPFLEPDDFQQALRHAAATVDDERLDIDQVA